MSIPTEDVTPGVLRGWGLPEPGDSKKSRGQVVVVGGSRRSPGAVLLAGEAALRVGAGRVGLVVPPDIEAGMGLAMPEAGVYLRGEEGLDGPTREALAAADAVLLGPGFADPESTHAALQEVAAADVSRLVLDAFAIGVLADVDRGALPADLIVNANGEEAAILLGRELGDDLVRDVREIAERFDAAVHCYGVIASPDGRSWHAAPGGPELGTAGSGDVLAGAIAGFAARGVGAERAAVWASWVHGRAGERLAERIGLGFLARDLLPELPSVFGDVDA